MTHQPPSIFAVGRFVATTKLHRWTKFPSKRCQRGNCHRQMPERICGGSSGWFLLPQNIPGWIWKSSPSNLLLQARGEYCSSGKYDVLIGWTVAVGPKFERLLQSDSSSYLCDTICHGGQTEAVCLVAKLLLTIWGKLNILLSSIFSIWPKGGNIFEICLVAKLMLTI